MHTFFKTAGATYRRELSVAFCCTCFEMAILAEKTNNKNGF